VAFDMTQPSPDIPAVLFVCLGNICRSPMAEGAFRAAAREAGLEVRVDSVGTAAYHLGEAPDKRAIAVARAHGIDIGGLLGRQIHRDDFYTFTHIFGLDRANLQGIKAHAPRDGTARISLLLDAVDGRAGQSIEDPYYGQDEDFQRAWDEIGSAVRVLVDRFTREGADASFTTSAGA
jgi:protein-tyrosine phosphatase